MNEPGVSNIAVPAAASPGPVLRGYAARELAGAIAGLGRRGGRIHGGVHRARKSLRRVRAVLALCGSEPGPGAELLDRELRRVNRRLSKLRDAQALVEVLDRLIRKAESGDSSVLLQRARRAAARSRAEQARLERDRDAGFHDARALLVTLQAALPALQWTSVTETQVAASLQNSTSRLARASARARSTGRDRDWHRWRRRARRLSQQRRALGDVAAQSKAIQRGDKAVAEWLGDAQDFALLHDHCGRSSVFTDADRRTLRALAEHGRRRLRERVAQAEAESPAPVAG
jgi:hypothetical protein